MVCFWYVDLYQDICELTSSIYIPRGINVTSLNHDQKWPFQPSKLFKVSNLECCNRIHFLSCRTHPCCLLFPLSSSCYSSPLIIRISLLLKPPLVYLHIRKWVKGNRKRASLHLSFSFPFYFIFLINFSHTLFSHHCPFPHSMFLPPLHASRLVATSQEEISLAQ